MSSVYLGLLIFLLAILIPACASSSLTAHMIYFVNKLSKQGESMQPWRTTFLIWNQSVLPCPVLTVASWPASSFLKRQVRWSGILKSFIIFHIGFGIGNKAKIDVFLELSCFFHYPKDVGNLICGSSAFSKTSLNIWKFTEVPCSSYQLHGT